MLSDGTNPEGVDPEPPLGWTDKASLTPEGGSGVVLVNMVASPPCAKLRLHLSYHGVPYSVRSGDEFKKERPDAAYGKIPVLVVNDRQVNDSFVILKQLEPVLWGGGFDAEWEAKLTFGLQLAIEVEAFRDRASWGAIISFAGYPSFAATLFPCVIPLPKYADRIERLRAEKDDRYGPLRPAAEYAREFRAAIGDGAFFGRGGDREVVGPIDVSFFGTLVMWKTLPYVQALLRESDLEAWWARMEGEMPKNVVGDA